MRRWASELALGRALGVLLAVLGAALVLVGVGAAAPGSGATTTTTTTSGSDVAHSGQAHVLANDPTVSTIAPICGDQDGSETPLVFNCSSYAQAVDRRYYQVPGSGPVTVHFDYVYREAACDNELAVFQVDDVNGSVNGVLPGAAGWSTQVASRNPQVVFASGSNASTPDVNLTFQGGELLAFRFRACGSTYYSYEAANGDAFDHMLAFQNTSGQPWQFAWEDSSGGGYNDFNDMILNVSAPGLHGLPFEQTYGATYGRGVHALAPTATRSDDVNTLTGAFTTVRPPVIWSIRCVALSGCEAS